MQLKNLEYRNEALKELKKYFFKLLPETNTRTKIVFKAPTGSGKTVTMALLLRDLTNELPNQFKIPNKKVAYIWIAPNALHLQSYKSLKSFFEETKDIRTMQFEDITEDKLNSNELLFLNWQSISSEDNLYVRESETDKTLYNFIQNTKNNDTEIVLILDEAHLFATKGEKAQIVLSKINAKIEIDVTATPQTSSDYMVIIHRADVVKEQMIKKGVVLNPKLKGVVQNERDADLILLQQALEKRNELAEKYKQAGTKINPLLLIQLPSESQKITEKDNEIKQLVIDYLSTKKISQSNNQLAIWLSNEKIHLDDISKNDSIVNVLLFKQAIALGWDCPRAHILLAYREMKQETFTVQTVGRILRMPEQKFYADDSLNIGYVFTNLEQDKIKLVAEEMDYLTFNKSIRKNIYKNLNLTSYYTESTLKRNRIGLHFREALFETTKKVFIGVSQESKKGESFYFTNLNLIKQKKYFNPNVEDVNIEIPTDVIIDSVQEGEVSVKEKVKFAKTTYQLEQLFNKFCLDNCGDYQKDGSWERIKYHLKLFFEEYFGYDEKITYKIILHNKQVFADLLSLARDRYTQMMAEKVKSKTIDVKEQLWEVPEFRIYSNNFEKYEVEKAILDPLFLRQNNGFLSDSKNEFEFIQFLESNKSKIIWWYKNGTERKADFAVPYTITTGARQDEHSLFFVDIVILFNNGTLGFFDPKTTDSEPEIVSKHNALIDYMASRKKTIGGIVIKDKSSWRYSKTKIANSHDFTKWEVFNPSLF